ncbi:uncharacterized protein LOC121996172 isoform X1 [Zingiber officinale]|uniref:uncharacterized protein LOC121996172 isoform X1 n=2 Tax=Zingiber officinale TaxID=94328 RepID=UPI001C4D9D74|nr:uncharacterized protein LOC121996172 isoform X1 [Zingiber officinale]
MESILARALEYTLKYWLKSFTRDQFKLQGRTAQLSNLDINGDSLHASVGFPATLTVTTAKVRKLEITVPSVSNVQCEPILVQIDKFDLVLEENVDPNNAKSPTSPSTSTGTTKGSGYGFADKIADGMTLEVGTVNLMIETHGGDRKQGGTIWSSPLASITIRNLLLYTTNENWQIVNLKEARDFSNNKKFLYVFKKLEWESLSVDLLPHPDMFLDAHLQSPSSQGSKRDEDGAKRLFFGGERFLEGISGEAYITVQRTEQNSPLRLEFRLHIPEAVCPALSEPGLRALLRFMTGAHICLNRGDVNLNAQQRSTEAAGCSLVSVIVDHIFLCIKDADFQLELLMQSLFFSRASLSDGETTKTLSRILLGGLFLRDTFSHPPCTLIQPSLRSASQGTQHVPEFGQNFCPPIYPLQNQHMQFSMGVPLISLHSLQINPSPNPPKFASQTVIDCQPLMIILQEESCFRISSFLADGIVVNPGVVRPDFSVNSFEFILKEFDLVVPLDMQKTNDLSGNGNHFSHTSFSGARLHVEDLYFAQSPSLKCTLLKLDTDPACFSLWEYQPVDASQKKWATRVSHLSVSLETCNSSTKQMNSTDWYEGLWSCVEFHEVCFEAAMATSDGHPLLEVPPPEGVVRIGVACQQYISNASVEQLFFVLDLYAYFGRVSEKITKASKGNKERMGDRFGNEMMKKMPSDTAVTLAVSNLHLKFLESSSTDIHNKTMVQFDGQSLFLKVSHRTLGGAFAVSTSIHWETASVYCLDGVGAAHEKVINESLVNDNEYPQMKAVFWVDNQSKHQKKSVPFLDITIVHVIPYDVQDTESHSLNASFNINGVRLGGGMTYTESLLHQFGIFGPDGVPGEGLLKGLKNLSSGPLAKLFRASPPIEADHEENETLKEEDHHSLLEVRMPDDIDVCVTFNNWLFALEGAQETEGWLLEVSDNLSREEKCWHTTFHSLNVKAKSTESNSSNMGRSGLKKKFPIELITVGIEGLQALKPSTRDRYGVERNLTNGDFKNNGVDVEVCLVSSEDDIEMETEWVVENIKFSVKEPIEAIATKQELEHLVLLCRSEVDSMGRIAAGMLRLLKLDKSLGQGTMDQLSNLGSGSMHRNLTPGKLSRRSSFGSVSFTPRTSISNAMLSDNLESTITSLEVEILDLQFKCSTLMTESQHVSDIKYLTDKLESMQTLLTRLRTLV